MGVFAVRPGREMYWLVARSEFNIKPGYESVDEILRSPNFEYVRCLKSKVGRVHSVKINGEDAGRISHACLDLHSINQRFG